MMRSRFDAQLSRLNAELIDMGTLIEHAIEESARAVSVHDIPRAKAVIALDRDIDQKEREIESLCLKLLLQQQPVAKDLRFISAALKMITDMERIGDQAADIAEITTFMDPEHADQLSLIPEMAGETVKMVRGAIDAFVRRDLLLANSVIEMDDIVDDLFLREKDALIALLREDPGAGDEMLGLGVFERGVADSGDAGHEHHPDR